MTIPKKKRKTIHLNNTEYEYAVGYHGESVYIKNTKTNKMHTEGFCQSKTVCPITPSDVKAIIIEKGL